MIWFGSSANLDHLADIIVTIHLGQAVIHPTDCVRDLGVDMKTIYVYASAHYQNHVNLFFHLRRLRKYAVFFYFQSRKRLACAVILTRVDYCNAVLADLPDSALVPLQRVLHAAARFVADTDSRLV